LIAALNTMALERTSEANMSVAEQLRAIGNRPLRALVLNLLPTQPEFALSTALARRATDDLLAALALLHKILRPENTLIVLDRHNHALRRRLRIALQRNDLTA